MAFSHTAGTLLLFLAMAIIDVEAQCSPPVPDANYNATTMELTTLIDGEAVALACKAEYPYSSMSTGRVYLSQCNGWTWTPGWLLQCHDYQVGKALDLTPCTGTPTAVEDSELLPTTSSSTALDGTPEVVGHFMKCQGELDWLSGSALATSTCENGQWSPVMDMCVEGCIIPRDCATVKEMGFTTDEVFNVITSGISYHYGIMVYCYNDPANAFYDQGGWTVVSRRGPGYTEAGNYEPNINQNNKFFLGMYSLKKLFWEKDGTPRPQTMQFLLTLDDNTEWHATYTHVMLDKETGDLMEVKGYYGDAGDSLKANVPYPWDDTIGWWYDGSNPPEASKIATDDAVVLWPTLPEGSTIQFATVRVRPTSYDESVTCPVLEGMYEPSWLDDSSMTTVLGEIIQQPIVLNATLTRNRGEGASVSYQCEGAFLKDGLAGGDEGEINCIAGPDPTTEPFIWDGPLFKLPCQPSCPSNFTLAKDKVSCYLFSEEPEPTGVVGAAMKCMEYNTSLAFIRNDEELNGTLIDDKFYFTTHVLPGLSTADVFANVTDYCDANNAVCEETDDEECMAVSSTSFQFQSCNDSESHYICMYPPYCPGNFSEYRGGCFQAIKDFGGTPLGALSACVEMGGALAYPLDLDYLDHLDYLVKELHESGGTYPKRAFIGLNNAKGDFTQGGMYPVQDDILSLCTGPEAYYAFDVASYTAAEYNYTSIPLEATGLTSTVCQFPGPTKCWEEPLPATLNMSRIWDNITAVATEIIYECYPGYFIDGNITLVNQTASCYGQLGEWLPPELSDCIAIDVCDETELPTYDHVVVTPGADHMQLNGTVNYTCPGGMGTEYNGSELVLQTTTCIDTGDSENQYSFDPMPVPCNVCISEPTAVLGTTDWVNTTIYYINDTVTVTCDTGHHHTLGNDTQIITCTALGWETPSSCYKACVTPPADAGSGMIRENHTADTINSQITYNCTDDFYFPTSVDYPEIIQSVTLTCQDSQTWEPASRNLTSCGVLCLSEPMGAPTFGNTSWTGAPRGVGSEVELSCPAGMLLGDGNPSTIITCEDSGNWSTIDIGLLVCRTPVTAPLPTLPEGMIVEGLPEGGLAWEEISVNYTCPNNTMDAMGREYVNITFNGTDWIGLPESFICLNTCSSAPKPPTGNVRYNYTGNRANGSVVGYYCAGGRFINTEPFCYSYCDGNEWNLTGSFIPCEQTTPGPSTEPPYILPTLPPYDPSYPATSDYYWGTLQNNMSGDSLDTDGPFGFGQAVKPDPCIFQEDFQIGDENCTKNPKHCSSGFSVSVWERAIVSTAEFAEDLTFTVEDQKYILSTGGDEDGHPGFAIYHKGYWLGAVVSTGDEYWKVEVAGVSHNNTWSNVALRWEKPTTANPKGLELFVNLEKVGQAVYGVPSSALDPLDPSMMMVGCHKAQGDEEFSGFNDAAFDELAMWKRFMPDNETSFFLGGFEANFSEVSIAQAKEIFARVDMSDPAQQGAAVKILETMTMPDPEPTNPSASPTSSSSGSSSSSSSDSAAQSTASSPTAAAATMEPPNEEEAQKHGDLAEMVMSVIDPETVPKNIRQHEYESMVKAIDLVSNMVSRPSFNKWSNMQIDPEEEGSTKIIDNTEKWLMGMSKAVKFTNGSDLHHTKVADNLIAETTKMSAEEFKDRTDFYEFPNYRALPSVRRNWNLPYDRIAIPTDLFDDERCANRPVNIIATLYDTYGDIAQKTVNPDTLDDYLEYNIDARVISLNVECNPQLDFRRQVDPRAPPCDPSPSKLKKTPVRFKLEHKVKKVSLRNLQFHTNETVTEINRRICVWFNPNISSIGAWDTTGCKVVVSTAEYTKCACDHFGRFTVMAEHTEPREVPPEELWLTITKYIGYILSFIALIAYIGVIAVSGDLKDQFHLIGLNLAVAVLFGSVFMLVSDMHSVRDDRHTCTAIGTLIHFFYLGAGAWIFALGHSSFKGITSGVISGRLKAYFFLAWSMPLMSMGLSYLLFMRDLGHDPRCFISWVNAPKYVFFGPQIFFCAVAFIFGLIVICNMATPALRKDNLIDDYGSFCNGASFVMIFFAFTWTFGLLAYVRFGFREPNFYPIFQVFNSCTGVVIFLFIGIGSKRFRMILAGQAALRRKMLFGNAFGTPPVLVDDKQTLGTPADQRSKSSSAPSSGRASPDFASRPPSHSSVAGRPGSRPRSGF